MQITVFALLCFILSASGWLFQSSFYRGISFSSSQRNQSIVPVMLFGGGSKDSDEKKSNGGFNMGNMMESLKKANEIGQKSKEMQKELETVRLSGYSANKKVKITVTGQQFPISCDIDDSLLSESKEVIEKSIVEAMIEAQKESLTLMGTKMADLYRGMGLPIGNSS